MERIGGIEVGNVQRGLGREVKGKWGMGISVREDQIWLGGGWDGGNMRGWGEK